MFRMKNTLSDPIERDGLSEGDRLYHNAFLDFEIETGSIRWKSDGILPLHHPGSTGERGKIKI